MKNYILNEGYSANPQIFTNGEGQYIFSKKKKYLDLSFSAGSLLLGHNSKIFKESIKSIIKKKISNFAAPNSEAINFSKLLKKIFPLGEKFVFCNSGTEAVMKSLRICRAISNKKLILLSTGSWHGSVEECLYSPDKNLKLNPLSSGLHEKNIEKIKFIPYNQIEESKKTIEKYKKSINCIIVEPLQASLPNKESKKYLQFLEKISKKYNITLIFDEMITGLRVDCSSIHSFYKIKPDIFIVGKTLGGGLTIGIIGLSKKIAIKLKKKKLKVFFGGTFSGCSINTYLGYKTTAYIYKNKKKIFNHLENISQYFESHLNLFFLQKGLKIKIYRFKSLLRIIFTNNEVLNRTQRDFFENKVKNNIKKFKSYLKLKKIYLSTNGLIFFSYATKMKDIEFLVRTIKEASIKSFKQELSGKAK
jgi:glutamate-1-semialdehyde 2,1-aminomutase